MTTVLLCTDEGLQALFVRRVLERAGYTVVQRKSNEMLSSEMEQQAKPDLILLDVNPRGKDDVAAVRGIWERSKCPIVLMTANPSSRSAHDAFPYEATLTLFKPFTAAELMMTVKSLSLLADARDAASLHLVRDNSSDIGRYRSNTEEMR
jgi:DNA-binding response OmpR family regulator